MPTTLIVGFGYLGREVAKLADHSRGTIYATTRSPHKFEQIRSAGCVPLILDWNDSRTLAEVPPVDQVLIAVAHDASSGIDRETNMVTGLERLLKHLAQHPAPAAVRVTYISTTGVYHQTGGEWVDETSTTRPTRAGGKAHLRAESRLRAWATHQDSATAVTLRLSGIYGQGRIPRATDIQLGRPVASPENGFLNLIHVHDAARAVIAGWELDAGTPHQTFCISDDQPVVRRAFYEYIAGCYDAPKPTFIQPAENASVRLRSVSNKRIWNRKMKQSLLPKLIFPSFREGLVDALALHP